MTAARYDITIDQGSDFALELTVKEGTNTKDFSDDETVGSEKRWGARAAFRKTLESSTVYSTDESFTATVTRDTNGKIKLEYPASASALVPAGTYLYDLELYQYDDADTAATPPAEFSVTRLIGGTLNLRREVTR